MSAVSIFVWLLILIGPLLAVAPAVLAAAPQIDGFWGHRPRVTVRIVGPARHLAVV